MMVTLSFVGAATKGKKIFDDDSIHSSNLVFQPLNPAVVQISLSQPSILGKLIDHGLAIIDVGDIWHEKGTFTIRAQAQDIAGLESEWGTLQVTMPRNKIAHNALFLRLLERFPNIFLMLRYLRYNRLSDNL